MAPIRKRASLRARAGAAKTSSGPTTVRGLKGPLAPLSAVDEGDEGNDALNSSREKDHATSAAAAGADIDGEDSTNWHLPSTKKDKRTLKRGLLLQKVRNAGIAKDARAKKPLKRRRPSKKLRADLAGLESALPDVEGLRSSESQGGEDEGEDDGWEGLSDGEEAAAAYPIGLSVTAQKRRRERRKRALSGSSARSTEGRKIVMKSLAHRPGAMKRKRKMEGREMERFGRNLAQLTGSMNVVGSGSRAGQAGTEAVQAEKWAALRRFIGGTMQTNPAFAKASG